MPDHIIIEQKPGEEPSQQASHELGAHDEQLKQHDTVLGELKTWTEQMDGRVSDLAQRIDNQVAAVPEEVWTRLNALENKAEAVPDLVADQLDNTLDTNLPPEPVAVPKPQPAPTKKPEGASNPFHSLLRRFR